MSTTLLRRRFSEPRSVSARLPSGVGPSSAVEARAAVEWRLFVTGLAVRIVFLTVAGTYVFRGDFFGFGWEAGRIASALATGRGFSDPFHGHTGPTAWLAPMYPALLAVIFKLFGVYSPLSGWVILSLNSVCSALTSVALYRAGRELFGETVGRRVGWWWALFPYAVYWPTRVVWDTSLTACLLAFAFLSTLRLARAASARSWAGVAVQWAALALTNPVTLSFLVPSWLWACREQRRRGLFKPTMPAAAATLLGLCVAPWLLRNATVFGEVVFIRGNLGEELRLGNGPGSLGAWMFWLHPTQDARALERYRQLGEAAFVRERGGEALSFIAREPASFLANSIRRGYWFWCGTTKGEAGDPLQLLRTWGYATTSLLSLVGLLRLARTRRPEAVLFASLLLFFPLVYYATFVVPRYRHAIEPQLLLLIAHALSGRASGVR